jgi:hypothetical protein
MRRCLPPLMLPRVTVNWREHALLRWAMERGDADSACDVADVLLMATVPPALAVEFLRAVSGFQLQPAELQRQRRPVRVDK